MPKDLEWDCSKSANADELAQVCPYSNSARKDYKHLLRRRGKSKREEMLIWKTGTHAQEECCREVEILILFYFGWKDGIRDVTIYQNPKGIWVYDYMYSSETRGDWD